MNGLSSVSAVLIEFLAQSTYPMRSSPRPIRAQVNLLRTLVQSTRAASHHHSIAPHVRRLALHNRLRIQMRSDRACKRDGLRSQFRREKNLACRSLEWYNSQLAVFSVICNENETDPMLYSMLSLKRTGSCGTIPIALRSEACVMSRISWPSINILPWPSFTS